MVKGYRKILMMLGLGFLSCFAFSQDSNFFEPNLIAPNISQTKAAVIVCEGMIDNGLYQSIRRRTEEALKQGVTYLIYQIETYGGRVDSADSIAKYFILEVADQAQTVAYVTTEAISAGALISVSCNDILMKENTTIGDCAPIVMGDKLEGTEREKAESFIRAAFQRAAEANKYPAALLKAMVTVQIEVYQVKHLQTGEFEYFETDELPTDANAYDLDNQKRVVDSNELLTLTASQAYEYGIARKVVDDIDEVLTFFEVRDNVEFADEPTVYHTNWSEEMVRWLNSPAVMGILVMLALLGVYVEFNTPGLGLPGLVAVICFVIIIGSKYLIGLANWLEVALFVVGLILLLVEIFVLPGFGVAGISGIMLIFAGLFGMLVKNPPQRVPWPQSDVDWQIFNDGAVGLLIGMIGFIVLAWVVSRYLPKVSFLSGLILSPSEAKTGSEFEAHVSAPPDERVSQLSIGQIGQTITALRPAGRVKFENAIVDVVAQGDFLEKQTEVTIIAIHGNRVVVKKSPMEG